MSENIFSNFYNRVLSFFQKDKLQEGESAKDSATNRLKLVLMQDRSNLDGATMQKMREQLIAVISKYIEIDQEALDLNLEADGDEIALMLNIPVIRARTREEIDEIEAKEQEELLAKKEEVEEAEEIKETDEEDSEKENSEDESEDSSEEENKEETAAEEDSENVSEASEEDSDDNSEEEESTEEEPEQPKSQKKGK